MRAHWPDTETAPDRAQGVPLACMQDLCGYWADCYDWRAAEARLNGLPQFRTFINDGVDGACSRQCPSGRVIASAPDREPLQCMSRQ